MNEILMIPAESPVLFPVLGWGINVIRSIQTLKSPGLTAFMKIISALGTEYVYIVVGLLIFWCINEKTGFFLGLLVIVSGWINTFLKIIVDLPRPFEFEPALGLAFEPSRSFPSGHAQNSMTFWAAIAIILAFRYTGGKKYRPLVFGSCGLIIFLIGFSRIYLGVHFPTDVIGGWLIALAITAIFFFLEKRVSGVLVKIGTRGQLITAAAAALLMNFLCLQDTSLAGLLLGFCGGYSIMIRYFPFKAASPAAGKISRPLTLGLRLLIGIAGAAVIYIGFKMVFPGSGSIFEGVSFLDPLEELFRFIRYGLLGFWASAAAPRIFSNFGLAPDPKPSDPVSPANGE